MSGRRNICSGMEFSEDVEGEGNIFRKDMEGDKKRRDRLY